MAPAIKAIQEDEKTIRVIVPGQFETTFTKRKGFGGVWFDLAPIALTLNLDIDEGGVGECVFAIGAHGLRGVEPEFFELGEFGEQ